MFHQVHGEGGLAHGRTPGNDHQVRRLQAGGHVIEITKAGRQAGHLAFHVEQLIDAIDGLGQQFAHADGTTGLGAVLADLEHQPLGLVDQLVGGTPVGAEGAVGDLVGRLDQLSQGSALTHDVAIGADIAGRGRISGQLRQVGQPAHGVELVAPLQGLGQGHHVQRTARLGQRHHGVKHQAMLVAIEIVGHQPVGDIVPGLIVEHQATQHRLLGLHRVRRNLQRRGFTIDGLDVTHALVSSLLFTAPCHWIQALSEKSTRTGTFQTSLSLPEGGSVARSPGRAIASHKKGRGM